MASRAVIRTVVEYLNVLRGAGIPVSRAIIYGSRARGDAHDDSDIDLLVVSGLFDAEPRARVGELWRLAAEVDVHLEPVPVGERRFVEDRVSPLLEMARREGIAVS